MVASPNLWIIIKLLLELIFFFYWKCWLLIQCTYIFLSTFVCIHWCNGFPFWFSIYFPQYFHFFPVSKQMLTLNIFISIPLRLSDILHSFFSFDSQHFFCCDSFLSLNHLPMQNIFLLTENAESFPSPRTRYSSSS